MRSKTIKRWLALDQLRRPPFLESKVMRMEPESIDWWESVSGPDRSGLAYAISIRRTARQPAIGDSGFARNFLRLGSILKPDLRHSRKPGNPITACPWTSIGPGPCAPGDGRIVRIQHPSVGAPVSGAPTASARNLRLFRRFRPAELIGDRSEYSARRDPPKPI